MNKIETLTDEQAAKIPEWVDEWVKIGLSTEPADFDRATKAAMQAYELCNIDKPMVVLRMSSPYAVTVGGAYALGVLRVLVSQVGSQVRSQVDDGIGNYGICNFWCSYDAYITFFRDACGLRGRYLKSSKSVKI